MKNINETNYVKEKYMKKNINKKMEKIVENT